MQREKNELKFQHIKEFFLKPLLQKRSKIIVLLFALVGLSLSQAVLVFTLGSFVETLFVLDSASETIELAKVFPKNLLTIFPFLGEMKLPRQMLTQVIPVLLLIGGAGFAIFTFLYQLQQQALTLWVARSFRDRLFAAILHLDFLKLSSKPASRWMSMIMNDVFFLQSRIADICNSFVKDGFVIISALLLLFFVHWKSALVLVIIAPFASLVLGRVGKRIAFYAEAFQKALAEMANVVLDLRRRFDFIRAQKGEKLESQNFFAINNNYFVMMKSSIFIRSAFAPTLEFIGFAIFALIIFLIDSEFLNQEELGGNLTIFLASIGLILKPLKNLGEQLSKFQETKGILTESLNILSAELETRDDEKHSKTYSDFLDHIYIKRLVCGYENIERFSAGQLKISKGSSIAIVGPSGSGKSTIVKTIAGLLQPIYWDANVDIRTLSLSCSLVSQNPFLFKESIKENLIYGSNKSVYPNDRDIHSILNIVALQDKIAELPEGLESKLDAINSNISGGQKQRLVVARSMLRDFDWLVFDEATSAIDSKTEFDIISSAIEYCRTHHKTFLSVTHRMQTLNLFDEIWFVESGKIIAQGSYEEIKKNERFLDFCGKESEYA